MKTAGWVGMGVAAATVGLAAWLLPVTDSQAAKPAAAAQGGVAGKVTFLKGSAQRGAKENGPFKPLKRNDDLREGEYVKTAADTRLEVKLADGSLVRLAPNSALRMGTAKAAETGDNEKAQAKLTAGKLWASVTKGVGSQNKFAVRTENAVAGVRGTTFRVNAETDGSTVVKVYEGAVAVSNGPMVEKQKAGGGKGPIDFKGRKEVAAPFKEVTLQEWEKIVGKMMGIKVAANGEQAEPAAFTAENDAADKEDADWVAWNQEQDKTADTPQ